VTEYRFLTTWLIDAPVTAVWDAIYDPTEWPSWWRGVERVEQLAAGDATGVGRVFRNRWRSLLPYTVEFDATVRRVEAPRIIELDAEGELAGVGRWRFFEGDSVAVVYEWNVHTTRPWMNALAPVARAAFEWNHDAIMRRGGEGLARRVGGRLLAAG